MTPRSVPTPAREAALREVLPRMLSWVRGQRGTCRRLGADEAESIATLALWEALECHSPDKGPLWPFAKTVAERRLWDALRKQRRREVLAPEVSLEGLEDVCHHHALAAREVPDVETPLLLAEILALQAATYALALVDRPDDLTAERGAGPVGELLRGLGEQDRGLLAARAREGLPWPEVAARLGLSERTAQRRFHALRERFRDALR